MPDQEHDHGHGHDHGHDHGHGHGHDQGHDQGRVRKPGRGAPLRVLTVRALSGISGDILLAGLARMLELDSAALNARARLVMPELDGAVCLHPHSVNAIAGWQASIDLPRQHEHRTLEDVLAIVGGCGAAPSAKALAAKVFTLLAQAESEVHGVPKEEVRFHEVGALDSILDTVLNCMLFDELKPDVFTASPLPVADGAIVCAHGVLPSPAPAVLRLLAGIPVAPFQGAGETVTPTGAALLKGLGASFGPWPAMTVERCAIAYGTRVFPGAPNGAIFALGTAERGQSSPSMPA